MLKISVIGIGNAGNQIADLAHELFRFPALAINSSTNDLNNVSISQLIAGTKGSGKDRIVARNYLSRNIDKIKDSEVLLNKIENANVVFIVASTGGGTGSGMSPLLYAYLSERFKHIKFILIGVIPEIRESIASQQNTIKWLKEVTRLPDVTYMLYDNTKKSHLNISDRLLSVNREVVEDMNIISGYYQKDTHLNSIDERDMSKIISTPGMIHVAKVFNIKEKDLDNQDIEDLLVDYMKNKTAMCEFDRDNVIKRTGLIVNLNDRLQKYMDKNLRKLFDIVGEPLEGFEHDYINTSSDETNLVIAILAGMSTPDDRIIKISERIDEVKSKGKSGRESILSSIDVDSIDSMRDDSRMVFEDDGVKKSDDEVDPHDIFSTFFD